MRAIRTLAGAAVLFAVVALAPPVQAGVVNPDISVIGQPVATWTDAPGDPARKRVTLDVGETELALDAALNPFARGLVIVSLSNGQANVEEAYFTQDRNLPLGLTLKAGKYRVGFGKLNPAHPHAYPFNSRFHVLAEYLPGADSFDETGVQLSERLPAPGDIALTASVDALQGDTFRITRTSSGAANDPLASAAGDRAGEPRLAPLGRLSAFVPVGDRSGLELGVDGVQGTNNVAAGARTTLLGADAKLKLWTSDTANLLVQGELVHLVRDDASWDSSAVAYAKQQVTPTGGYLFANLTWRTRWNAGLSYERYRTATLAPVTNQAVGAFAGLALMEETTLFRLSIEHLVPGTPAGAPAPSAVNTVQLGVIWSMGPHKPHQF